MRGAFVLFDFNMMYLTFFATINTCVYHLRAPYCILNVNHMYGMKAPPILLYFSENRKLLTQI